MSYGRLAFVAGFGVCLACARPPDARDADVEAAERAIPTPKGGRAASKAPRPRVAPRATEAVAAGLSAFDAGNLARARQYFGNAIKADPRAYEAHYGLGILSEREGADAQALAAYAKALSIVGDHEPAIEATTRLYLRTDQVAQAEAFLNRLRARYADNAAVLAALAEVRSVQKDSNAAQELAQESLKHDPTYRPAMVVMARDHYRNRRLDLAEYALTAILDGYGPENPPRDANNGEARLLRALIWLEQNRRGVALNELRRAVELRPDLVEARLRLAALMLEAGNAAEAVPLLEGALAYDAMNPLVHLGLGDAYRLQGRPEQALIQLDWVTKAAPDLAEPHYNIGLVYLFSDVPGVAPLEASERAIREFETFEKMRPRSRAGAGDDVDQLLQRARHKKMLLQATHDANSTPSMP